MAHGLMLDITPNIYAIVVVAGMVTAGLALGIAAQRILGWLGVDLQGGSR
ncbi:MAG: hypothetical protein M1133_16130 [Armatimonadetes bacterium]|nr:hypothetical protein [Armatimonadota bacterium]